MTIYDLISSDMLRERGTEEEKTAERGIQRDREQERDGDRAPD